jgi:hypothetical protein
MHPQEIKLLNDAGWVSRWARRLAAREGPQSEALRHQLVRHGLAVQNGDTFCILEKYLPSFSPVIRGARGRRQIGQGESWPTSTASRTTHVLWFNK